MQDEYHNYCLATVCTKYWSVHTSFSLNHKHNVTCDFVDMLVKIAVVQFSKYFHNNLLGVEPILAASSFCLFLLHRLEV